MERKHNVDVIYAVRVGSRAWGLQNAESDCDIHGIFRRPIREYLSIWANKYDDTLESQGPLTEEEQKQISHRPNGMSYDVKLWDVQKTMGLLLQGNGKAREIGDAPDIYKITRWGERYRDAVSKFYNPSSYAHRYLSLSRNEDVPYMRRVKARLQLERIFKYGDNPIPTCFSHLVLLQESRQHGMHEACHAAFAAHSNYESVDEGVQATLDKWLMSDRVELRKRCRELPHPEVDIEEAHELFHDALGL